MAITPHTLIVSEFKNNLPILQLGVSAASEKKKTKYALDSDRC